MESPDKAVRYSESFPAGLGFLCFGFRMLVCYSRAFLFSLDSPLCVTGVAYASPRHPSAGCCGATWMLPRSNWPDLLGAYKSRRSNARRRSACKQAPGQTFLHFWILPALSQSARATLTVALAFLSVGFRIFGVGFAAVRGALVSTHEPVGLQRHFGECCRDVCLPYRL